MITERSLRTTIRWTPVCGPAPVLYRVSAPPAGWPIVNETVVGFPDCATFVGSKPTRRNVFAGAIVICGGEFDDEEERSEEHTSELQSHSDLVCRLLLEKKKKKT